MFIYVLIVVIILIGGLALYHHLQFKKAEKQYPPVGKFVVVDHCKIHYISEGQGPPVVFLHGGILSSSDFKEAVHLAAKQGYHAIAIDRPGYGYSERPKNKKVTPITQAKIIHEALQKLEVEEPIILVGHSWSGTMTLSYAIHYPDSVAGILLLGGAMYKEGYPAENGDLLSKLIATPILGDFILYTLLKTPLAKGMASSMVKATYAPEKAPEGYVEKVYALGFRPTHFKANRQDVLAFPRASYEICNRYKEIKIFVGEKDPFYTIEQGERLRRDIAHATYHVIPDVGHMIPELHPQKVVEGIKELTTKTAII
ncbi:alpha/beta fold hydrolase [Salirhabdus sp. Marseille-P4669]|uniref:alpha/beta fold hydrolase n=1 Tax=Salirhabdus sp. Marseille-P4669 TaxID=2042310 RepID=UPI000C799FE0|nr:alpha/beta hydrolase [Salirhabdus sp. Marseille-P4669]